METYNKEDKNKRISKETIEKYSGKAGIYAIYIDETIVYIGETTDLLRRFNQHKQGTLYKSNNKYNKFLYRELRRAINNGHDISLKPIEYINGSNNKYLRYKLHNKEEEYIRKYNPYLNVQITQENGNRYNRWVKPIKYNYEGRVD